MNRRNEAIDARDFVLDDKQKAQLLAEKQRRDVEEDEEVIRRLFYKPRADGQIIRRIEDDEDELSQEGSLGLLGKRNPDERKIMESVLGSSSTATSSQNDIKSDLKCGEGSLGLLGKRKLDQSMIASSSKPKPQSDLKSRLKGIVIVKKTKK